MSKDVKAEGKLPPTAEGLRLQQPSAPATQVGGVSSGTISSGTAEGVGSQRPSDFKLPETVTTGDIRAEGERLARRTDNDDRRQR